MSKHVLAGHYLQNITNAAAAKTGRSCRGTLQLLHNNNRELVRYQCSKTLDLCFELVCMWFYSGDFDGRSSVKRDGVETFSVTIYYVRGAYVSIHSLLYNIMLGFLKKIRVFCFIYAVWMIATENSGMLKEWKYHKTCKM